MEHNYKLNVQNMQFWGRHGNFVEEQKLGQKFFVDVQAVYDMDEMCKTDILEKGLSYLTVYDVAKRIITEENHKLVQRMAYRIGEELFAVYPKLESAKVTVKKPFVPIQGIVDYVSVTVEMKNEQESR